jgi:glycosyltransferase involved in cell wall biosynthesis
MKIAFIIPWYGENILGGAETECRTTAENLKKVGIEVEILTTCAKEFLSDWNTDYYRQGVYQVNHIPVRRFSVRKRDTALFDSINYKLMQKQKISLKEEEIFIQEMINSDNLYTYIWEHRSDYDFFLFIPYIFGTTYYGSQIHPEKSILIPCLHDESYAHMTIYKKMFENVKGIIYLSYPEKKIAAALFNLKNEQSVLGGGIDTNISYDATRFKDKYQIQDDFILYAGRRESGKNISLLIDYFCRYKNNNPSQLKLILIGSGEVNIPQKYQKDIIDLGFVSHQNKYDAYAAAMVLCQPSVNESFSIVIMESWLCGTPVLVHNDCAVTKDHCIKSNGGLYFKNFDEFEMCINYYISAPGKRIAMAKNGKRYVETNYSWDEIVKKYTRFFEDLRNGN